MMLSTVDPIFFPALCILHMLLCTASFWIVFYNFICFGYYICYENTYLAFLNFSFDPPPLCSDFVAVYLRCNGVCLSLSTLLNIVVRHSIISFPPSFTRFAFHLDLLPDFVLISYSVFFSWKFSGGLVYSRLS